MKYNLNIENIFPKIKGFDFFSCSSEKDESNLKYNDKIVSGPVTIFTLYRGLTVSTNASEIILDGRKIQKCNNETCDYKVDDNMTIYDNLSHIRFLIPDFENSKSC